MSSSKRYYYRRYMNRFINSGGTFESISSDCISDRDIQDYLNLHIERWQTESAAITKYTINFHKEMSKLLIKNNHLKLFFAKQHGKRIAALSCIDCHSRREFYYSGRILNDKGNRSGKLLVMYSILDAIKTGSQIYDFGYGGDNYKYDFTDSYNTLKGFVISSKSNSISIGDIYLMYEKLISE